MNVLFICNGNVARSQEAAIFFNTKSRQSHAQSAGINVKIGKPLDPLVVLVMGEIGYSTDGAVRKIADIALLAAADLVISFKPHDELPETVQQHPNIHYWHVPDPQHQTIEFHRQVRDAIQSNVGKLVAELES